MGECQQHKHTQHKPSMKIDFHCFWYIEDLRWQLTFDTCDCESVCPSMTFHCLYSAFTFSFPWIKAIFYELSSFSLLQIQILLAMLLQASLYNFSFYTHTRMHARTHACTHTHTHTHRYMRVCVCVCVNKEKRLNDLFIDKPQVFGTTTFLWDDWQM